VRGGDFDYHVSGGVDGKERRLHQDWDAQKELEIIIISL
jgi:hypothetical protein